MLGQLAPIIASSENPLAWKLTFGQTTITDPELRDANDRVHEIGMAAATPLIQPELRRRGVDPDSARARVMAEVGLGSMAAVARWSATNPSVPRKEIVEALAGLLWNGLRALQPADG